MFGVRPFYNYSNEKENILENLALPASNIYTILSGQNIYNSSIHNF